MAEPGSQDAVRETEAAEVGQDVPEERRVQDLTAMLEYARDDAKQVYLRVTAALAIAVLYVTQLPFAKMTALAVGFKVVLLCGLLAVIVVAVSYFVYVSAAHNAQRTYAAWLRVGETDDPRAWWDGSQGPAGKRKWWLRIGNGLFLLGGILLAVVFAKLMLGDEFPSAVENVIL